MLSYNEDTGRKAPRVLWKVQKPIMEYSKMHRKPKTKRCSQCKEEKPLNFFGRYYARGKYFLKSWCKRCKRRINRERGWDHWYILRESEYRKRRRRQTSPRIRAHIILMDSRQSDRRHKRKNDMTCDFITSLIMKGCLYCECSPSESKMTLDRIDNTKGHCVKNVVSACLECNLTRGSMPYSAWKVIVPAMKRARNLGLLRGWLKHSKPNIV